METMAPCYVSLNWTLNMGHSEPAPASTPSTGCLLLLSCGWMSTESIFGFTSVTNCVGLIYRYIGRKIDNY
jgi:hypothetical protein